jgi:hypothetical protein
MPVSVRKATEDDLHSVYVLLSNSTLNSAWIPLDARKRMFRPVWGGSEKYYGYVMEDGGEVVGFLGTLFTERDAGGKRHKFCEIHSWYVKDEYRNESLKLFLPVMSVRNATLLNYTPTRTVYDISKKFGWDDLETSLLLFLPVPTYKSLGLGIGVETRKHAIVQYLDEADKQIFLDHENIACHHFLIREKNGTDYAYVIIKKMRLGRFRPFGRIVYASNKKMLLERISYLKMYWCLRLGLAFVVMDRDEADITRKLPFTKEIAREIPSLYKSKDLKPEDIKPPLYTLPLLIGYRLH